VVLLKDGQVLADGRPDEQISPENLKKLYRVCVCVAHSETGISAFVPMGLGKPAVLVGDQRNKPFRRA
jgi:ABC-type cobalamin/Fe3+-siderophores transport system ATPase subunit